MGAELTRDGAFESPSAAELPPMPDWYADRPWPEFDDYDLSVEQLLEELRELQEAVEAPGRPEPWQCDDPLLLAELSLAQQSLAIAHARWLALLGEAERRGSTLNEQSMPTASWLSSGPSHSRRAAQGEVRLATQLLCSPHVAEALGEGAVSLEQATVIVRAMERLPDDLDNGQRDGVEAHMVELAREFNPDALKRLVNHAVEVVAPEVADDHDRRALERAERRQQIERHVAWKTDPDDGSLRFWGKLPAVEGELFKQHLTAIADNQRAADALMGVETSRGQALADALALTVGHHATCEGGPVRGGDHTRVVVTMGLDELVAGVGVGTVVEGDEQLTAGQARRLACSARLVPMVLDGDSVPLDYGRSRRFFTPHQRVALAVRDGGCAFPGCDRPPSDCEAHHAKDPWHADGLTDLADGVLLCPHHHHLVEPDTTRPPERNWLITFDERGRPVFHAPALRGERVTRQHHRYRI